MRISDWSSDVCSSDLQALMSAIEQLVEARVGADPFMEITLRADRQIFLEFLGEQHLPAAPAFVPAVIRGLALGKDRQTLPDAGEPAHAASMVLAVRPARAWTVTSDFTCAPRSDSAAALQTSTTEERPVRN